MAALWARENHANEVTESFGKQTVEARNGWVRTVNAFVSVAALAQLDEAKDRSIFGPLHDAEAKADLRSARRTSARGVNGNAGSDTTA